MNPKRILFASSLFLIFLIPFMAAQLTADQQAAIASAQASLASSGDQAALQSALSTASAAQSSLSYLWIFVVFGIVFGIAGYVFLALALIQIARKTNTPKEWMAWVPFADALLMNNIARTPMWSFWTLVGGIVVGMIPGISFIGWLAVTGIFYWWCARICARFGKPGWWAYVMASSFLGQAINSFFLNAVVGSIFGLAGIAGLVLLGMLAWGKTTVSSAPSVSLKPSASTPLNMSSSGPAADEQLMNWIKAGQQKGYAINYLKDSLIKSGHSEYDVNNAVLAVLGGALPVTMAASSPASPGAKPKKDDDEKKKKRKNLLLILLSAAGLILFLLLMIWLLTPSTVQNLAPTPQVPAPAAEVVNTTLPKTFSSSMKLSGDVTLRGEGSPEVYSFVMQSSSTNDQETNNSFSEVVLSAQSNTGETPFKLETQMYLINPDTYINLTSDIMNQWIKITPNSPAAMLENLGVSPDKTKQVFDLSKQNALIENGKIEYLNSNKTHLRVVLSNKQLGEVAKLWFTLISNLVPEMKEKYHIDKYTPVYDDAVKTSEFDIWLDDSHRMSNGTLKLTIEFNEKNLIPSPGYNPITIVLNAQALIKAYDYGLPANIVLPDDAKNAISVEDLAGSMLPSMPSIPSIPSIPSLPAL